jgi:hypothetical protein
MYVALRRGAPPVACIQRVPAVAPGPPPAPSAAGHRLCDIAVHPSERRADERSATGSGGLARRLNVEAAIGVSPTVAEHVGVPSTGGRLDAVSPTMTLDYAETANGHDLNGNFGDTGTKHTTTLTSIEEAANTVKLTANHKHEVDIALQPSDDNDVRSADAECITPDTFQSAYADLYPNAIGRAPRKTFWSSKIVKVHEQSHKRDSINATNEGIAAAKSWLGKQTIAAGDAQAKQAAATALLVTANQQIRDADNDDYWGSSSRDTAYDERAGELRAFATGKPSYVTLASQIRARGRREGWPGAQELRPPQAG